MSLDRLIRRALSWWRHIHPDRTLERIPAYRAAAEAERRALAHRRTQELSRARRAKREAVLADLRGVAALSQEGE